MSNNLTKKLLAESFDAFVNDGDAVKATRLFKRYWDLEAKNRYAILESADEDFEITDMGDDFNNEMADEIGSDAEENFNQIQIAIDELEDKFPAEMSDEVHAKFDDLRNIVDEMKLSDGEEDGDENLSEDASIALEDLKGEFEMAGDLDEEVSDLFDEISAGLQGDEEADDVEEIDVADEEEGDVEADDMVEEAEGADDNAEEDLDDIDIEFDEGEEADEENNVDDLEGGDEEPADKDSLVDDIKYSADELVALIDELDGLEGGDEDKEAVEESWGKIADPRKGMTSEKEGVNKQSVMNYKKSNSMSLEKGVGLDMDAPVSKGKEPSAKAKVSAVDNKGAKQWHKIQKPSNKPASAKSLMGN